MYFIFPTKLKRQKLFIMNLAVLRLIVGIFVFISFYFGAYNNTFGITPDIYFKIVNNLMFYSLIIDLLMSVFSIIFLFLPDHIINKKNLLRWTNIIILVYNFVFSILIFSLVIVYFTLINHKQESINDNSRDNYTFLLIISSSFSAFNSYYFYIYYSNIKKIMFVKKNKSKSKTASDMFIDSSEDDSEYINKIKEIFNPSFDSDKNIQENDIDIQIKSIQNLLKPNNQNQVSEMIKEGIDMADISNIKSKIDKKKNKTKNKKTKALDLSNNNHLLQELEIDSSNDKKESTINNTIKITEELNNSENNQVDISEEENENIK